MACSGPQSATRSAAGDDASAPDWFTRPTKQDARYLYFVGSANGAPDETTATELAVQKAMFDLSVYCGATLNAESLTVDREKNGRQSLDVSVSVSIAGEEISIREARTDKQRVFRGRDGQFDAYVRVQWPLAEYARLRRAQQDKAASALAFFREALTAERDRRYGDATEKLRETRKLLAGGNTDIPLDDPKYRNSGVLRQAAEAMQERLKKAGDIRSRIVSVAVLCRDGETYRACESRWVGNVRQRVTGARLEVASQAVTRPTAEAILESGSPSSDRALRTAGYVLAVRYDARNVGEEDGFVFARCGARGVVFGTERKEIVVVHEVTPKKGGHIHYEGARQKACEKAEKELVGLIDGSLVALKGNS